jgi:hypothetical protein
MVQGMYTVLLTLRVLPLKLHNDITYLISETATQAKRPIYCTAKSSLPYSFYKPK